MDMILVQSGKKLMIGYYSGTIMYSIRYVNKDWDLKCRRSDVCEHEEETENFCTLQ